MVNTWGIMYFNGCREEKMSPDGFQITDIFTWQVAAWVLVILAAGFIGQFGKSFAKYVMGLFNRKKIQEDAPFVSVPPVSASPVPAPPEKSVSLPASSEVSATGDAKIRKKEAKALVKAKKKENKAKEKGLNL